MLLKKDDLALTVTRFGIDGRESWPVVGRGLLQTEIHERTPNWQEVLREDFVTAVQFKAMWFCLTLDVAVLNANTVREIARCSVAPGRHDLWVQGIPQDSFQVVELVLPGATLTLDDGDKFIWSAVGQDWRVKGQWPDAKQAGLLRLLERLEAEDVTFTMTRGYTLAHGQGERVWVATMARRGTVGAAMGKSMYEALLLADQRIVSDVSDVSDASRIGGQP